MPFVVIARAALAIIAILFILWPGKLFGAGSAKVKALSNTKQTPQERPKALREKPNDRIGNILIEKGEYTPKIYFILDGVNYSRPSFETYYAESNNSDTASLITGCSCDTVGTTVCACDQVCTCNPQCACQSDCTCNGQCSCESFGGSYCSCNQVCTCVPVY